MYKITTINDLIEMLNDLPEETRALGIYEIRVCEDRGIPGYQFILKDNYVIIPCYVNDAMFDSYGKKY